MYNYIIIKRRKVPGTLTKIFRVKEFRKDAWHLVLIY